MWKRSFLGFLETTLHLWFCACWRWQLETSPPSRPQVLLSVKPVSGRLHFNLCTVLLKIHHQPNVKFVILPCLRHVPLSDVLPVASRSWSGLVKTRPRSSSGRGSHLRRLLTPRTCLSPLRLAHLGCLCPRTARCWCPRPPAPRHPDLLNSIRWWGMSWKRALNQHNDLLLGHQRQNPALQYLQVPLDLLVLLLSLLVLVSWMEK